MDAAGNWLVVNAGLQAAAALVGLLSALAAWLAALSSKRAADEMKASRQQYVKPVIVVDDAQAITIDLGSWREDAGAGIPKFDALLHLQNVGKGPAFDVEVTWKFRGNIRAQKILIDVVAINEMLSNSLLEVLEDDRNFEIRIKDSSRYTWFVSKSDFISNFKFKRIKEEEVVSFPIPSDVLGLQILHALNQMAIDSDGGKKVVVYSQPNYWLSDARDQVDISFRSITDDIYGLHFDATPRLGLYGDHPRVPFLSNLAISLTASSRTK